MSGLLRWTKISREVREVREVSGDALLELLPISNIASSNVASFQLGIGIGCWQHFHIGNFARASAMKRGFMPSRAKCAKFPVIHFADFANFARGNPVPGT